VQQSKKPVLTEKYDEIVFTNPSPEFFGIINRDAQKEVVLPNPLQEHFTVFSEAAVSSTITPFK
jgi:hypothetical protein